ncbi:MAG: hypothetical protein ACHQQS_08870 [Thermoanaerobaculales bacterium]
MNLIIIIIILFVLFIISAFIGAVVGQSKNRSAEGVVYGCLLGPLGWLIAFYLSDKSLRCPACSEKIQPGASICPHCRHSLAPPAATS